MNKSLAIAGLIFALIAGTVPGAAATTYLDRTNIWEIGTFDATENRKACAFGSVSPDDKGTSFLALVLPGSPMTVRLINRSWRIPVDTSYTGIIRTGTDMPITMEGYAPRPDQIMFFVRTEEEFTYLNESLFTGSYLTLVAGDVRYENPLRGNEKMLNAWRGCIENSLEHSRTRQER